MLRALKASGISEKMLQMPYMRNNEAAQLNAQYKDMKKEWRENVYLARSRIQGLGLYAKRDLDMNQMVSHRGKQKQNRIKQILDHRIHWRDDQERSRPILSPLGSQLTMGHSSGVRNASEKIHGTEQGRVHVQNRRRLGGGRDNVR
jgi:hypothetical protein